jgi:hypothetical protein
VSVGACPDRPRRSEGYHSLERYPSTEREETINVGNYRWNIAAYVDFGVCGVSRNNGFYSHLVGAGRNLRAFSLPPWQKQCRLELLPRTVNQPRVRGSSEITPPPTRVSAIRAATVCPTEITGMERPVLPGENAGSDSQHVRCAARVNWRVPVALEWTENGRPSPRSLHHRYQLLRLPGCRAPGFRDRPEIRTSPRER